MMDFPAESCAITANVTKTDIKIKEMQQIKRILGNCSLGSFSRPLNKGKYCIPLNCAPADILARIKFSQVIGIITGAE